MKSLIAPLLLAAALGAQSPESRLEAAREAVAFDPPLGTSVPVETRFADDQGRAVTLADCIAGRPTVLVLVYCDCPMLCNEGVDSLTHSLQDVQLVPGDDDSVALVSIDPTETAADAARRRSAMQEQTRGRAGAAGWSFLTGSEPSIRARADAVGFCYQYVPENGEYAHASGISLLSQTPLLTRAFRGIEYPPRDLQLGLVESSRGEVGSVVDRLLLFCYHWDPTTGRYGVAIASLLRIGGGLTVGVLAVGIALMIRRDRRRARTYPAQSPP